MQWSVPSYIQHQQCVCGWPIISQCIETNNPFALYRLSREVDDFTHSYSFGLWLCMKYEWCAFKSQRDVAFVLRLMQGISVVFTFSHSVPRSSTSIHPPNSIHIEWYHYNVIWIWTKQNMQTQNQKERRKKIESRKRTRAHACITNNRMIFTATVIPVTKCDSVDAIRIHIVSTPGSRQQTSSDEGDDNGNNNK